MTDDEWTAALHAIAPVNSVRANTYLSKKWTTWSQPAVFLCDDGHEYVVKSPRIAPDRARAVTTEQVISYLGKKMGAPVGETKIVSIPAAILTTETQYLGEGLSHGSKRIPNCSEREWLMHTDLDENRPRFAMLAVLYGWTVAQDHQLIYHNSPPELVHSVDHGLFFFHLPRWTPWTAATLATHPPATLFRLLVSPPCSLSAAEISIAIDGLRSITTNDIANAVSQPPESWGISRAERIAFAKILDVRRDQILAAA